MVWLAHGSGKREERELRSHDSSFILSTLIHLATFHQVTEESSSMFARVVDIVQAAHDEYRGNGDHADYTDQAQTPYGNDYVDLH